MPIPRPGADSSTRRTLVRERVREQIRQAILDGTLQPGERLDEASLRAWLDVSATPIRQALQALELEGLIESAPQSHTIVATPRVEMAMTNLQAVGVLLSGVSLLTVPSLDAADRDRLAGLAESVAERLTAGDGEGATQASGCYFLELIDRCPNPVLVRLTRRFGAPLGFHVVHSRDGFSEVTQTLTDAYARLGAAMRTGDPEAVNAATLSVFLIAPDGTSAAPAPVTS